MKILRNLSILYRFFQILKNLKIVRRNVRFNMLQQRVKQYIIWEISNERDVGIKINVSERNVQ